MKDLLKDVITRFFRMLGKIFGWAGIAVTLASFLFIKYPEHFPPWCWFATILIAVYKQKAYDLFKLALNKKEE